MKKRYLYIMVTLMITSTVVVILFFHSSRPLRHDLILADSLMNTKPDSSLAILNRIEITKDLSKEETALYALLMTQAQFKNRRPVESDSLIKIAYKYFIPGGNSLRKAQTYLYYARVFENMDNKDAALINFQKASISALDTNNFNLLGLIYNRWGMFLQKQYLFDDALSILQKSLDYLKLDNDTVGQMFTLKEIGKVYTLKKDYFLALDYYKLALKLAAIIGNNVYLSQLYNNLSILHKYMGEYDLAIDYINKSLSIKTNSTFTYSSLLLKGDIFSLQQRFDSARYYLNIGKGNNNLFSNAAYNILMSNLEAGSGNYKSAISYLNLYIVYSDTIKNLERKSTIAELQKKYDYSLIANENNELKLSRQQMQIMILLISLISIITTILFLYYYYRKRSVKRSMKIELDKMQNDLINERANYYKEKTIEAQKSLIKEQELIIELSQKTEALKYHQEKEQELKDRIFKMDAIVQKINTFISMKPLQRSKSGSRFTLSFQELNDLEEAVNICFDNFASRLRAGFPKLKDDDIHLCCLLKMKVPNKSIFSLLDTNELALKKRRYRIKHDKMDLPDDVSCLDDYLEQF